MLSGPSSFSKPGRGGKKKKEKRDHSGTVIFELKSAWEGMGFLGIGG